MYDLPKAVAFVIGEVTLTFPNTLETEIVTFVIGTFT